MDKKIPEADSIKKALAASDQDIARVAEDLIQLLIAKKVILFTELPEAVQAKLVSREALRNKLDQDTACFLDESEAL
ncbi:hypothetical protein [Teredinibacter waterburyi]|jgi:hypothetical protein|uniref:hypothetical protein n=1 Tax=Teredinibacter waterburyi TaxID=1500538 RepID=UPI00165F4EC8|nr:hypothetical protein [Teredinibacter waterburyi]